MVNGIFTTFTMRGKENKIKSSNKENVELSKKIHDLEIENAKLTTRLNTPPATKPV